VAEKESQRKAALAPLPDYLEEALRACCVSYDPAFIEADEALRQAIRRFAEGAQAPLLAKIHAILNYLKEASSREDALNPEEVMAEVSRILGVRFPEGI
jgi:hypothetical protein